MRAAHLSVLCLILWLPTSGLAQGGVDWKVTRVTVQPSAAQPGDTVTVTYEVENVGTTTASAAPVRRYVLATNAAVNARDLMLLDAPARQHAYPPGGILRGGPWQVRIPGSTPAGQYFLGILVDPNNVDSELDKTNNAAAAPLIVGGQGGTPTPAPVPAPVPAPTPPVAAPGVDWTISSLQIQSTRVPMGRALNIDYSVSNAGAGVATLVPDLQLYISTDRTITRQDVFVGGELGRTGTFGTGQGYSSSQSIGIISLAPGTYFLGALVDPTNASLESREDNNTRVLQFEIVPASAVPTPPTMPTPTPPTMPTPTPPTTPTPTPPTRPATALPTGPARLLDRVSYRGVGDVWGEAGYVYVAGRRSNVVYVVDARDPSNLREVARIRGVGFCQDVKVQNGRLYATNEGSGPGISIWDVRTPAAPRRLGAVSSSSLGSVHNVFISGNLLYAASNSTGSVHVLDVSDPAAPRELSRIRSRSGSVHDMTVVGSRVYSGFLSGGLYVNDVSNPRNPLLVGRVGYSRAFTHNAWPSADGRHAFTTDENSGGHMRVWDISNPQSMRQVGSYGPNRSAIIHNVVVRGSLAFIAYYELGLKVVDVRNPAAPREVASYDTYTGSTRGQMTGAWGVFPFHTDPEVVFISDSSTGLYAIRVPGIR